MKWFQHQCDASENPKIDKLIMKYGMAGYGLYFYILEKIGKPEAFSGFLSDNYDLEYISLKTKIEHDLLFEIIDYMVKINLFDSDQWAEKKRIYCPKLMDRADEYTKRINRNKRKSEQNSDIVRTTSEHSNSKIQENKIEKNKIEKNKIEKKKSIGSVKPALPKKSKSKIPTRPQEVIDYYHKLCKNKYDINYAVLSKDIGMFSKIWKLSKYNLKIIEKVYESAFYDSYWWNTEDHIVEPATIVMRWNDIMARINGGTKKKIGPATVIITENTDLSKYPSQTGWEDMEEDIRNGNWKPTDYSNNNGKTQRIH